VVGAGSTTLHIAVASTLLEADGYSAGEANGVAFVVATLASYWLNTIWTFGAPLGFGSLLRFALVAAIGRHSDGWNRKHDRTGGLPLPGWDRLDRDDRAGVGFRSARCVDLRGTLLG
jgi:hypothetical protein